MLALVAGMVRSFSTAQKRVGTKRSLKRGITGTLEVGAGQLRPAPLKSPRLARRTGSFSA
jgi:hypothetical protein